MTLTEYQSHTMRTCPDLGEKLNLSHMVLGMCSELNELFVAIGKNDTVNTSEEIADIWWYVSNYCNMRNINLTNTAEFIEMADFNLINGISLLQDYVKKFIAYNKPIDREKELAAINVIKLSSFSLAIELNIDISVALQNNINKLKIRFKDKFTQEEAITRNLEEEYNTLKTNITDGTTNEFTESN